MRQIAERAGLALGGIYNHFASKEDIFQALIDEKHPLLRIFPNLERTPGSSIEEFVHNAARLVKIEMGHDPNILNLMFIEIVEFKGKHLPGLIEKIFPMAIPLLQSFSSPESHLRPGIHSQKLLRILIGNILAFYLTELILASPDNPPGLQDISLDDFLEVFLHGILEERPAEA
jgi:AcrR family transcriptional regulator